MTTILDLEDFKISIPQRISNPNDVSIINDKYVDKDGNELSVFMYGTEIIYACKIDDVVDHMFKRLGDDILSTESEMYDMLRYSMLILTREYLRSRE